MSFKRQFRSPLKRWVERERNAEHEASICAEHTVPPPRMPFIILIQRLDAFRMRTDRLPETLVHRRAASVPVLQEAALDFLKYRFTPIGASWADDLCREQRATDAALSIVPGMSEERRDRFFSEIVFNVAQPGSYLALRTTIIASISPYDLEIAIMLRVQSSNRLHARNAIALPQYVFTRGFKLSREGRAALALHKEVR